MPQPEYASANSLVYAGWRALLRRCPALCSVHPNVVTLIALLLTVPVVWNLVRQGPLWSLVLLAVLRELLDMLDGTIARECGTSSTTGAILDIVCDTVYTAAVGGAFVYAVWPLQYPLDWVVLVLATGATASMLRELLQGVGCCHAPLPSTHVWFGNQTVVLVPLVIALLKWWVLKRMS